MQIGRVGTSAQDLLRVPGVVARLRKLVVRGTYDVVHAHLGLSEVLAAAATPVGVPIVASRRSRNLGFEDGSVRKLIEGLGHRRVALLLCNARFLAEVTAQEDRWPPPTRVIYNAVDPAPAVSPPPGPPHIVVVANLHPYKRLDRFLLAFRRVAEEIPGVKATLVGDGSERPHLRALAGRLGLDRRVHFAGQVDHPGPTVDRGHVVALTSDHEGFPNALLEAMAHGRPVLATRVGGVPELIRDGIDGLLADPDVSDVATGLRRLLVDASMRGRMGAAARARAATFTWDRLVSETEAAYADVLNGKTG
jgi:glycosyltransferase involved in cell wall biosynthesis